MAADDASPTPNATGAEMWQRVMVGEAPTVATGFIEMTRDHVFGEVWSRPGLSVRDRRLISLTCTALAASPPALAIHVDTALRSGDLDVTAIEEWIIHLAHYAGWPVAANVFAATREAVALYSS